MLCFVEEPKEEAQGIFETFPVAEIVENQPLFNYKMPQIFSFFLSPESVFGFVTKEMKIVVLNYNILFAEEIKGSISV